MENKIKPRRTRYRKVKQNTSTNTPSTRSPISKVYLPTDIIDEISNYTDNNISIFLTCTRLYKLLKMHVIKVLSKETTTTLNKAILIINNITLEEVNLYGFDNFNMSLEKAEVLFTKFVQFVPHKYKHMTLMDIISDYEIGKENMCYLYKRLIYYKKMNRQDVIDIVSFISKQIDYYCDIVDYSNIKCKSLYSKLNLDEIWHILTICNHDKIIASKIITKPSIISTYYDVFRGYIVRCNIDCMRRSGDETMLDKSLFIGCKNCKPKIVKLGQQFLKLFYAGAFKDDEYIATEDYPIYVRDGTLFVHSKIITSISINKTTIADYSYSEYHVNLSMKLPMDIIVEISKYLDLFSRRKLSTIAKQFLPMLNNLYPEMLVSIEIPSNLRLVMMYRNISFDTINRLMFDNVQIMESKEIIWHYMHKLISSITNNINNDIDSDVYVKDNLVLNIVSIMDIYNLMDVQEIDFDIVKDRLLDILKVFNIEISKALKTCNRRYISSFESNLYNTNQLISYIYASSGVYLPDINYTCLKTKSATLNHNVKDLNSYPKITYKNTDYGELIYCLDNFEIHELIDIVNNLSIPFSFFCTAFKDYYFRAVATCYQCHEHNFTFSICTESHEYNGSYFIDSSDKTCLYQHTKWNGCKDCNDRFIIMGNKLLHMFNSTYPTQKSYPFYYWKVHPILGIHNNKLFMLGKYITSI